MSWFQQYIENQNVVRNSKRLQKPKDKSKSIPCVFTTFKQLQLKLGHCQPLSKGYVGFFFCIPSKKKDKMTKNIPTLYIQLEDEKSPKLLNFFFEESFHVTFRDES